MTNKRLTPIRRLGSLWILLLLIPGFVSAQESSEAVETQTRMLRLRGGDVLFGSIESHAPEQLRFKRLDTGGLVNLPWSFLDPKESETLRLGFGYVDSDREELTVDATLLRLANGTELVGLVDAARSTDTKLWLKRATGGLSIPRASLRAKNTVRVPALDVYTKEELYLMRAAELAGALLSTGKEGAAAHDNLARYSERLFDFVHAADHYRTAIALDPDYESFRMAEGLARSARKAVLETQVAHLAEIDLWRARQRYDRAIEMIESFPRLFPDTPLLEDWNAVRRSVERSQKRDLSEQLVNLMHSSVVKVARAAAREKDTYEKVLAYIDEGMERDLLERVRDGLQEISPGIESDQVRVLWGERKGGRYQRASYGLGTWILGEDRARENYDDEQEESEGTPARGSQKEARKKLEERIDRYLKNQELARRARSAPREEDDPAVYWARWDHGGRYAWVLAYFVEFSGLFKLEGVRFDNCRECGGSGAREVIFSGGASSRSRSAHQSLVPCPLCHTVGVTRRVRYR